MNKLKEILIDIAVIILITLLYMGIIGGLAFYVESVTNVFFEKDLPIEITKIEDKQSDYTPWDIDIRGGENNTVMASGVIMIDCKNVTVDKGGEDQLIKCEKLPTNHDKKTGELK